MVKPEPQTDAPTAEPPGKRALHKARTREALRDAAMRLFRERGFDAVTVAEICAEVDVARRTWFRYFPSKESVVFEAHEARLRTLLDLVEHSPRDEPVFTTLRRLNARFTREFMKGRAEILEMQRLVRQSPVLLAREREIDREWESGIEGLMRARAGEGPEVEKWARVVAGASMGVVAATLRYWFSTGGVEDLERLGEEALDCLEAGFPTPG